MKALLVSAAAVGLLTATPAFAQAGPTATANGTADAIIVQPISVAQASGGALNFGKIAAIAGTVTVNPDSTFGSTPNMIVDDTDIQAATFNVTGEPNLGYSISLPSATTTIDDAGAGVPMSVALNLGATSGVLSAGGGGSFNVGGVLSVANGQLAGSYTGTFQVQVQYD